MRLNKMRYRTAPGVVQTSICGRYFLVTPEKTIQINETAAFYWRHLAAGIDEASLLTLAESRYEIVDPEALREDYRALTELLREERLLVRYDY